MSLICYDVVVLFIHVFSKKFQNTLLKVNLPKMIDERLVEAVKEHEVLYNLQHRNYRRTDLKDAVWRSIAEKLGTTGKNWLLLILYFC